MLMTSGTSIQVPDDMQNGKQTKLGYRHNRRHIRELSVNPLIT